MTEFTKEQVYIVTGASSGIGEEVALQLNGQGATVVAIARNAERLESMKAKCKCPENMYIEIKDLAEDVAGLPKYVKTLKEKYGKFSGMAYCAGIGGIIPLQLIDYEYAMSIFNINYFAPLFMTKGIADRRNNVGNGCSLVYLSSIDAVLSSKGQPLYSGTKAALSASIRSIARDVSANGVRMNCLLPSMIETPMTQGGDTADLGIKNVKGEKYPFGWGKPEDVANMVIYLLSDKSKFISGQNYILDSGGAL